MLKVGDYVAFEFVKDDPSILRVCDLWNEFGLISELTGRLWARNKTIRGLIKDSVPGARYAEVLSNAGTRAHTCHHRGL